MILGYKPKKKKSLVRGVRLHIFEVKVCRNI